MSESESDAPSESLTVTLTVELAGPSGNVQSKLPAPVVVLKVSDADLGPVGAALGGVEDEGVVARVADGEASRSWCQPSLAVAEPVRVTVGATFRTDTLVV